MKVGLIAWERFGYGGVSRILSSMINELSTQVDISVLCLKDKSFFQNVYGIDTDKVQFSFMELTNMQKARREIANFFFSHIDYSKSIFLQDLYLNIRFANSYLNKIATWANEGSFDVVVFSTGFEGCIQLAILRDKIKPTTKLVAWSHASFKDYFREDAKYRAVNNQALWSRYYRNFDEIVVLSDADVTYCKEYLGLHAQRIYNSNSFIPQTCSSLHHKKFLYVGSLSDNKGFDLMVDAFVNFSQKDTKWSIDIYGEGPGRKYVENAIKTNALEGRMHLHNYTTEVESVYCDHDILILPSRYEGFGIVQIEAASCGLPIIAADLPITRELIGKYDYGELFKWNDSNSLAEVMYKLTKVNLSKYAVNGKKAAEDFKANIIAKEWFYLFKELSDGKSN